MNDRQKIDRLKKCFEYTIWMAIRYAHGRSTFAPEMVREAIKDFQSIFPDWSPKEDSTIEGPKKIGTIGVRSDYLDDLVKQKD